MKNVKVTQAAEFKPIHVEFDLETLDEAREFWHRLNVSIVSFESFNSVPKPNGDYFGGLWDKIDSIIRGMK